MPVLDCKVPSYVGALYTAFHHVAIKHGVRQLRCLSCNQLLTVVL